MKRPRDEGCAELQIKRSATSNEDPSGKTLSATAAQASNNRKLSNVKKNALAYLKDVQEIFWDKREKYDEFLKIMKDFRSHRLDTPGVVARVKRLFRGHYKLIWGFNTFLPKEYEITSPFEDEFPQKMPVNFNEAIEFITKVKTRFLNDGRAYKSFLKTLNMYREKHKSIEDVYQEVASLFQSHDDLLEEFVHFLPRNSASVTVQQTLSGSAFVHRDERSYAMPTMRHGYLDKEQTYSDRDPSVDRSDTEHDKIRKCHDMGKDGKVDGEMRDRNQNDTTIEYDSKCIVNFQRKWKSSQRVDDSVIEEFMQEEGAYTEVIMFCAKVREKLHTDTFQEFLKCIQIYNKGMITRFELKNLVDDILGTYPNLLEGFNEFLAHCENIDGYLAIVCNEKSLLNGGHWAKPVKPEYRDEEQERERDNREKSRAHEMGRDEEGKKLEKNAPLVSKTSSGHKISSFSNEKYNMSKDISELDLSNCQRCTPSYRLLPKNYQTPPSRHRTAHEAAVLNDVWVSMTSGSEDYSFKNMRKNQFEESLFMCEDDRFELDMLIESVTVTTKRMEELLEKMKDNTIKSDGQIRIEDQFTALNLRCIERLYGDHGLDVMDILRKNACVALPVILIRLKQKQDEWSRCRADLNKVWVEVYAKNYDKSLDHRSFYFKQQDMESLSTKALLAEIKDINEKKRKEDDGLLAIPSGNQQPIIPSMEFEYSDLDLHEDLYHIIKYSSREVCTSMDQGEEVMRIWTSFLEPMLGVPPRPHGAGDAKATVKTNNGIVKRSMVSMGEYDGSSDFEGYAANIKQLNVISNGDDIIPAEARGSHKDELANRDSENNEGGFHDVSHTTSHIDTLCAKPLHGKIQNKMPIADGMTEITMKSVTTEQLTDNGSLSIRGEQNHGRKNLHNTSGISITPSKSVHTSMGTGPEPQFSYDILPLAEGGENEKPTVAANGGGRTENTKVHGYRRGSSASNKVKIEREQGELSPNEDFEEDTIVVFEEAMMEAVRLSASRQVVEVRSVEVAGRDDSDVDDEGENSAQMSSEDSENVSEVGKDVLGSESGDDAECSHEDHKVDENSDHNDQVAMAESECEDEGVAEAHDVVVEGMSSPFSGCFQRTVEPLPNHVLSALHDKDDKESRILYANNLFYVLIRLHRALYERILSAKMNSSSAGRKRRTSKDSDTPDQYAKFLSALYNLLDGSDNTKFEDSCRAIFGTQSYMLFTLDKLISKVIKQLQVVASNEMANKLLQLYAYEKARRPGRFVDLVYHENARLLLGDEIVYRFESCSSPTRLSIQLME